MANGGKIRKSDVIDEQGIVKGLKNVKSVIDESVKSLREFVKQAREINKAIKGSKSFPDLAENAKKAETNIKKLTVEEKKLAAAQKRLAFELSEGGKKLAQVRREATKARKANNDFARSQDKARKSTNTWGKALGSFAFKFNALGNIAANVAAKITQFARQLVRDGIRGVVDFDDAITNVRAVAGATEEQFERLRQSAIDLGAATKFTATEVANLQFEYAKLGFTTEDILALQDSTLKLATATRAELGPAAKVVGGAIRAYGLRTKDAERVASALAIATTKSALAFEDYETILSTVAPVSNAYNFSLEDTLALLGQLKNANFDASSAATATRNILLNLADANGDLAQALGGSVNTLPELINGLVQLRESGVDLATTLELTDKRSVAAFNTFLFGAENALVLKGAISDANEELDELVNVQLTSLRSRLTLLQSAYQGLVQAIADESEATSKSGQVVEATARIIQNQTEDLREQDTAYEEVTKKARRLAVSQTKLGRVLQGIQKIAGTYNKRAEFLEEKTAEAERATNDLTDAIGRGLTAGLQKLTESKAFEAFNEFIEDLGEDGAEAVKVLQDVSKILQEVENESFNEESLQDYFDLLLFNEEKVNKIGEDAVNRVISDNERRRLAELDRLKAEAAARAQDEEDFEAFLRRRQRLEEQYNRARQELGSEAFNFITALNQRQLEQLQANAEAGLITEEKAAEESLRLRQRQARIDKAQALFNIGVNTAVAISKLLAETALVGIPLIPVIAALGVAQAATVIASPIPQFGEGGDIEGPSHAGGGVLINAEGGEHIFSKAKTRRYRGLIDAMEKGTIGPFMTSGGSEAQDPVAELLKETNERLEILNKKPVASSTVTPSGVLTMVNKGSSTIKKIDRYFL